MEFVIVAPLYFILFGGLFMLGDMITNKIRFHIGEHFVTWVGASRYCPVIEEGTHKGDKDPEKVKALIKPMYDLSIGGAVDDAGFRVDTPDEKASQGNIYCNNFMQFYMGRIKHLPIQIPGWVRGMLAMGDVMKGSADMNEYATAAYGSEESFHSYSFHRLPLSGIDTESSNEFDKYCRSRNAVPSVQLVNEEIVSAVISDDEWINELGSKNGGAPAPEVKIHRNEDGDVKRILCNFAQ